MSNGIQAYESGDGACFLSSGTLAHGSRDLFNEGKKALIFSSSNVFSWTESFLKAGLNLNLSEILRGLKKG